MKSAREAALLILYRYDKDGAYINIAFKNLVASSDFSREDTAFIKELVFGTVKHKITLDYTIRKFSKIRLKKISPYILNILRMSIYQMLFMDKIPKSAAVNEGVKLAKKYGHAASVSFTNAILRKSSELDSPLVPDGDNTEALSISYSHPENLVQFYIDNFGVSKAKEILKANMEIAPLCVRVNRRFKTRDELIDILNEEGFSSEKTDLSKDALFITSGGDVTKTKAYEDGLFTIQDQSSQLVAQMLCPQPNEMVLDMCSAPGGKTTHLAELMDNKGEILAFDLYEKRLLDVNNAAQRLKIDIIKTKSHDAEVLMPELVEKADRILLDVPCSGIGIIRRKPDIKYKEELLEFSELVKTQKNILKVCSKYLKPGGTMIYSTCTINPAENISVIKEFLNENPDFSISSPDECNLSEKALDVLKDGYGTFLPGESDGFFICRLKRVK